MGKPNAANAYITTLNGAINNSTTSLTVTAAPPAELLAPFRLRLVAEAANTDEIVTVTNVSGSTFTIVRASEPWNGSSSASAHSNLAVVEHNFTAATWADAWPNYPSLKPALPTDDFNGPTLDSAWAVHSVAGTLTTSHVVTKGTEWMGSSAEIQYSAQMGTLKRTQANTDFDFTFGGARFEGGGGNMMFGVAALDSSGNGVGVISYNDGNCYFISVSSYQYSGNSDNWGGYGWNAVIAPYWFRLKRISGTWTGYISVSGRTWDKTFATRADSVTVADIHFGTLYNTGVTYNGRMSVDFYQKDI